MTLTTLWLHLQLVLVVLAVQVAQPALVVLAEQEVLVSELPYN